MTAVEWIFEELENKENGFPHLTLEQIYKKAKEMEKQQERSYSEEDMKDAYIQGTLGLEYKKSFNESFYKWFEQFKNK